jgi:cadmium resistance protein CadD (predicted permease)
VDDLFVLLSLYASQHFRPRQILAGQYLGFATLVLVSIAASLVSLVLRPEHIGWLGLVPIAIGLRGLHALRRSTGSTDAVDPVRSTVGNVLAVAGITLANGGDNIAVYTSVFANSGATTISIFCAIFVVMVAAWLAFARWLVSHPSLGKPIRRYGHIASPVVLILAGVYILYIAGSLGHPSATS